MLFRLVNVSEVLPCIRIPNWYGADTRNFMSLKAMRRMKHTTIDKQHNMLIANFYSAVVH